MDRPPIGGSQKAKNRSSLDLPDEFEYVYNRSGTTSVIGDVFIADIAASQAETTAVTGAAEDAGSPFRNVILVPSGAGTAKDIAPVMIAMEAVADNALMKVQLCGWIAVINATNVGAAGAAAGAGILQILSSTGTAGKLDIGVVTAATRAVGWNTSAHTAAAGAEAVSGWFDGRLMRR